MSSRVSLTLWGEGTTLALVGQTSSDGIMIKMPYGVDVLHCFFFFVFFFGLVKTKSDFIITSVETSLGRRKLVLAVISVDAYPFLAFSDLTCYLQDTGIGVFWLHRAA